MTSNLCLIVNPAAGRGAAAEGAAAAMQHFTQVEQSDVFFTTARGDEAELTHVALGRGYETIVVVGGDGTCSRVAQAVIERGSDCRVTVVPCGTGNDFAKTLGIANYAPEQIAALVARKESQRMDAGLADGHYFINSCGFGFDASVLEATQRVRLLKGNAVYIYSALRQLFTYRGLTVATPGARGGRMLMVTVSNGRHLGGAFLIAPHASVLDGQLDVSLFADCNVVERARIFAGALRGTHLGHPAVRTSRIGSMELSFDTNPAMEIDGELRYATSRTVEITCAPRALSVIAAPGALL
ncbi:MAG TPA: YegS/Rv2252/BmrU family lipid kinase [Gemmatimonadaceae bacterium]|nr:YegS/Rv2252/BmrU family lipid kinase [Gemmatimonadaceae bacterium]